ncbi:WXG100 family type VII secretion target [Nonomuraea sp. LPB2021202275-12-8]|uniref:WXG100 family type VII secretion target n=1 Tax=Nonomuraea sp. LPB2021202275-12-8 TaxID=3120159 RepID=UPI00300C4237
MSDISQMMDQVEATPSQLKKASGHIADTAQYVEGLRVSVETTANGLLASGWMGPAAQIFRRAMTTWDNSMRNVRTDLEQISETMSGNAVVYEANDADVQAGMNRVNDLINVEFAGGDYKSGGN